LLTSIKFKNEGVPKGYLRLNNGISSKIEEIAAQTHVSGILLDEVIVPTISPISIARERVFPFSD
jgi:hypothetical protein